MKQTIVWAIDAFPDSFGLERRMASALRALFPSCVLIPVYVLSDQSFAARGFSRLLRSALKPAALKSMSKLVADVRGLEVKKPRILCEASASQDECAHKLVRFAYKVHADLIAVGSHGRTALSRLLGLSFSEAVLTLSRIPVLIAGPSANPCLSPPQSIVFATDFSAACAGALDGILNLAEGFGAELHLFHKNSDPLDVLRAPAVSVFADTPWPVPTASTPGDERCRFSARGWLSRAEAKGVKTHLACENFREPTSRAIVQYLSRLGDASAVVAMVAQAGVFAGAFLGSVTREVIRQSPYPVYIAPVRA